MLFTKIHIIFILHNLLAPTYCFYLLNCDPKLCSTLFSFEDSILQLCSIQSTTILNRNCNLGLFPITFVIDYSEKRSAIYHLIWPNNLCIILRSSSFLYQFTNNNLFINVNFKLLFFLYIIFKI